MKIIFDADILKSGLKQNNLRSGIYFAAYNLLKNFCEIEGTEIVLRSSISSYEQIVEYCQKYFPDKNFEIITDVPDVPQVQIYDTLRQAKSIAKQNENRIICSLISLIMNLYAPFVSSFKKKHYKTVIKPLEEKGFVYFSPAHEIPKIYKKTKLPKYTLLHDTIPLFLQQYWIKNSNVWFWNLLKSINKNDNYFTNSNATKYDFLKYCPQIDPNKIHTTLLACDESFKPCSIEEIDRAKQKYKIPQNKKYIFSLCTIEPRKNLVRAIKTFIEFVEKNNIDDLVFVLGGGQWKHFIEKFETEADINALKERVLKIGYVDDENLAALYSGAEWFVYTSQYEGFGLPPLEAMSSGAPVITSNNSSLPEVVGDSGIMIDWDSDEQHIEAYEKYYFNPELREQNRNKGLERAEKFSWKKCAKEMCEYMKQGT